MHAGCSEHSNNEKACLHKREDIRKKDGPFIAGLLGELMRHRNSKDGVSFGDVVLYVKANDQHITFLKSEYISMTGIF